MVVREVNALDLPEIAKSCRNEPGQKMIVVDPESFKLALDFSKYTLSEGSKQVVRQLIEQRAIAITCQIEYEPTLAQPEPGVERASRGALRWALPFRRNRPNVAV